MCKESRLSGKNGTGGILQLSKGYRSEIAEYSSSKMVDKASSSTNGDGLDVKAIRDFQKEVDKKIEYEEIRDETPDDEPTPEIAMYPSKCPQCKSIKIVKGKEVPKHTTSIYPCLNFENMKFNDIYLTRTEYENIVGLERIQKSKDTERKAPNRYHYSVRVKYVDDKEKWNADKEIAEKKAQTTKDLISWYEYIKNRINNSSKKHERKIKIKKISNGNSSKSLKRKKSEAHSSLPKMWYEYSLKEYHHRTKETEKMAIEYDEDNNIIATCDTVQTTISVDIEKLAKEEVWTLGNDVMEVKCLMSTSNNPSGTVKIPLPTPLFGPRRLCYLPDNFYDDLNNKNDKKNIPYRKELVKINEQLKELRTELDYWNNQILDANDNMTEYVCKKCKISLEKNCLDCRDEYIEIHGEEKLYLDGLDKNEREFVPLLKIYPYFPINKSSPDDPKGIPVCNECVTKFGKEEIENCL